MAYKAYFGTPGNIKEIPAPASGMGFNIESDTEETELASGGRAVFRAPTTYKTLNMNWSTYSTKLQHLIDLCGGSWGRGPFYITDPTASEYNVLPPRWSNGWQLAYQSNGWCKPFVADGNYPSASPLNYNTSMSAVFTQASSGTPALEGKLRTRVIRVPGQPYYLTVDASATGTAGAGFKVRGLNVNTNLWVTLTTVTTFNTSVLVLAASDTTYTMLELDMYMPVGSRLTVRGLALGTYAADYIANVLRTNLATNPSFETASGTVTTRTNLATNPSAETNLTGWVQAGAGVGTLTRDTTKPLFGIAAVKYVFTSGSASGVQYGAPLAVTANTTYTLSFYVYLESGTFPTVQIVDGSYGNSVVMSNGVGVGAWTRLSKTFTTGASQTTLMFYNTTSVASVFYLDGILLEQSPTLGDYFDGSTPLQNLITNPSFEVDLSGVTASNGATLTRDTSKSYVGAASMQVAENSATSTQGFRVNITGLTVGRTYNASAWVYVPTGTPQIVTTVTNIGYGTTNTVNDAWQQLNMTFVATATTQSFGIDTNGNAQIGKVFWVDALMCVSGSSVPSSYYEGQGDFTYAWTGTANASASVQQAPGMAWWVNQWYGSGASGVAYQSTSGGMNGGASFRKQWVNVGGGSTADTGVGTPWTPVVGGASYTFSAYARCSVAQNFTPYIVWRDATNTTIGNTSTTVFTPLVAGSWTRVSVTATAPAGAATAVFITGPRGSALPMPSGAYFDVDQALIEASPTLGDYFDGSTANGNGLYYNWTGTANASASVVSSSPKPTFMTVGQGIGPIQYASGLKGTLTSKVIDRIGMSVDFTEVQGVEGSTS